MSLTVELAHTVGAFSLDVAFEAGAGLTALVGPSGSGKTTVLNAIAGVLRPQRGRVRLEDDELVNTQRGVWLPPHRRRLGYVFQEPRLFPHLTVRQNLSYGAWFRRHHAGRISPDEVIGLLNLESLLARRTSRLSGGEKQRVALGRALLASPRLLLLDEPLASVDQQHRTEILPYLDRLRATHVIPVIYVTHTWAEVADRAAHVVELRQGRVVFSGSIAEAGTGTREPGPGATGPGSTEGAPTSSASRGPAPRPWDPR